MKTLLELMTDDQAASTTEYAMALSFILLGTLSGLATLQGGIANLMVGLGAKLGGMATQASAVPAV